MATTADDDPQFWCSCPLWVRKCEPDCPSLKPHCTCRQLGPLSLRSGDICSFCERAEQAATAKRSTRCPKCNYASGDDWRQCKGACPIPGSPYHDELTQYAFEQLPLAKQDEYGADETRLRNIP